MWIILIFLFLASIVFGALTTLPLVVIVLLCLTVIFKRPWIFALAFFAGLFLDLYFVRVFGESSVFFLIFIFLLFLYERKFEIQTVPFVIFAAFLGSLAYLLIFDNNYAFEQAVVSSIIAVSLFKGLVIFKERKKNFQQLIS